VLICGAGLFLVPALVCACVFESPVILSLAPYGFLHSRH